MAEAFTLGLSIFCCVLGFFEGIMTLKIDFKKVSAKVSNPALKIYLYIRYIFKGKMISRGQVNEVFGIDAFLVSINSENTLYLSF